jgi:hypothetical protein
MSLRLGPLDEAATLWVVPALVVAPAVATLPAARVRDWTRAATTTKPT